MDMLRKRKVQMVHELDEGAAVNARAQAAIFLNFLSDR